MLNEPASCVTCGRPVKGASRHRCASCYSAWKADQEERKAAKPVVYNGCTCSKVIDGVRVRSWKCASCLVLRKRAWVGRALAEISSSKGAWWVTLTLAGSGVETANFDYSQVQNMLKALRRGGRDGWSVRYLVAGEHGSLNGRCHWHMLMFFPGEVPEMPVIPEGRLWEYWPHGWASFEALPVHDLSMCYVRASYAAFYAAKDAGEFGASFLRSSLKPGLGYQFFVDMGIRMADASLSPDGYYYFQGLRHSKGPRQAVHIPFMMRGAARDYFVAAYTSRWAVTHERPVPVNDWLDAYWKIDHAAQIDWDAEGVAAACEAAKLSRVRVEPAPLQSFVSDDVVRYLAVSNRLGGTGFVFDLKSRAVAFEIDGRAFTLSSSEAVALLSSHPWRLGSYAKSAPQILSWLGKAS